MSSYILFLNPIKLCAELVKQIITGTTRSCLSMCCKLLILNILYFIIPLSTSRSKWKCRKPSVQSQLETRVIWETWPLENRPKAENGKRVQIRKTTCDAGVVFDPTLSGI